VRPSLGPRDLTAARAWVHLTPGLNDEALARRLVADRAGGRCELCGKAGHLDWSHRRARKHGGPWAPSNGMHLCRRCHSWAEHEPVLADAGGWRIVHRDPVPGEIPVWLGAGVIPCGWYLLGDDGLPVWVTSEGTPRLPAWSA